MVGKGCGGSSSVAVSTFAAAPAATEGCGVNRSTYQNLSRTLCSIRYRRSLSTLALSSLNASQPACQTDSVLCRRSRGSQSVQAWSLNDLRASAADSPRCAAAEHRSCQSSAEIDVRWSHWDRARPGAQATNSSFPNRRLRCPRTTCRYQSHPSAIQIPSHGNSAALKRGLS